MWQLIRLARVEWEKSEEGMGIARSSATHVTTRSTEQELQAPKKNCNGSTTYVGEKGDGNGTSVKIGLSHLI